MAARLPLYYLVPRATATHIDRVVLMWPQYTSWRYEGPALVKATRPISRPYRFSGIRRNVRLQCTIFHRGPIREHRTVLWHLLAFLA